MDTSIRGGSHLIFNRVVSDLHLEAVKNLNLVLNTADPRAVNDNQINILWTQHNWNQPPMKYLHDPALVRRFDAFVFVSNWQYDRYRNVYKLPEGKCWVIPNAVAPLNPKPKLQQERIRLVYASTPWRGLEVLLDAFEMLERDDVELEIFSSTQIYGEDFDKANSHIYEPLLKRASQMPNVIFRGYQPNEVVRASFESAHILAYPSIFEETSCLTAIEAGSAGLEMVVTNYGALYETCAAWARYVTYQANRRELAVSYKNLLKSSIEMHWSKSTRDRLEAQKQYFDYFYSINKRLMQWREFLSTFGLDLPRG